MTMVSLFMYTLFFIYGMLTLDPAPLNCLPPELHPSGASPHYPACCTPEGLPADTPSCKFIPYVECICCFLNGLFCAAWIYMTFRN